MHSFLLCDTTKTRHERMTSQLTNSDTERLFRIILPKWKMVNNKDESSFKGRISRVLRDEIGKLLDFLLTWGKCNRCETVNGLSSDNQENIPHPGFWSPYDIHKSSWGTEVVRQLNGDYTTTQKGLIKWTDRYHLSDVCVSSSNNTRVIYIYREWPSTSISIKIEMGIKFSSRQGHKNSTKMWRCGVQVPSV